jgi:hypothetical protein
MLPNNKIEELLKVFDPLERPSEGAKQIQAARFFPGTFFPEGRTPVAQTDFQSSRTSLHLGSTGFHQFGPARAHKMNHV